jgi:hypothetical protein
MSRSRKQQQRVALRTRHLGEVDLPLVREERDRNALHSFGGANPELDGVVETGLPRAGPSELVEKRCRRRDVLEVIGLEEQRLRGGDRVLRAQSRARQSGDEERAPGERARAARHAAYFAAPHRRGSATDRPGRHDPALVIQLRHAVGSEDRLDPGRFASISRSIRSFHSRSPKRTPMAMRKSNWISGSGLNGTRPARRTARAGRSSRRSAPHERDVDRAATRSFRRSRLIALRIPGLALIGNDLVEQAMLEQPVGRRRLADYTELERFQLGWLEAEQIRRNRHAVEPFALHVHQRIGRAVVGLRGRSELEPRGYAHDEVALEAVGVGVASAQRVADEAHPLRKPRVLERPSQIARQELGNLVLEAFARAVRERQVVRILADAEHTVFARGGRALLGRCGDRQQQRRRDGERA